MHSTGEPGDVRRGWVEVAIVLGLSLGASALYAVLNLVDKLTAGPPLAAQKAVLNPTRSPRPWLDLAYQLTEIAVTLVPVALVLYLLTSPATAPADGARRPGWGIGLDRRHPRADLGQAVALALLIGLPGLAFYALGRHLGITAEVVASALSPHWWTVPVLVLQAVKNALLEEVIVVGYLLTRLDRLGVGRGRALLASAGLRGAYHLYQGFGPFVGNAVMGLVFGAWFTRRGRVMPLVLAHTLLDLVAFLGYAYLGSLLRPLGLA